MYISNAPTDEIYTGWKYKKKKKTEWSSLSFRGKGESNIVCEFAWFNLLRLSSYIFSSAFVFHPHTRNSPEVESWVFPTNFAHTMREVIFFPPNWIHYWTLDWGISEEEPPSKKTSWLLEKDQWVVFEIQTQNILLEFGVYEYLMGLSSILQESGWSFPSLTLTSLVLLVGPINWWWTNEKPRKGGFQRHTLIKLVMRWFVRWHFVIYITKLRFSLIANSRHVGKFLGKSSETRVQSLKKYFGHQTHWNGPWSDPRIDI